LGVSLIAAGCIIFGGVMTVIDWNFAKLSTSKYETNCYVISEEFKNILIDTETSDIVFMKSDNAECTVECFEQTNMKHTVAVENGALSIKAVDTRKWYEYIGINIGAPKIKVCMPQGEYRSLLIKSDTGDVDIPADFKFERIDVSESTGNVTNRASASDIIKIKTSTGDIFAENISASAFEFSVSTGKVTASGLSCGGSLSVKVSTGKTRLCDIVCGSVVSVGSTGDIYLDNVIASEKLSVERSTGGVRLDGCDASAIFIKTSTGKVSGSLLSDKVFVTETDTGRIDVPDSAAGGKCEVITSTGNIELKISARS